VTAMTFAGSTEAQRGGFSIRSESAEDSYAFADWWGADSPLALTADHCAALRALRSRPRAHGEPWRADHWDVLAEDLTEGLVDAVVGPVEAVNNTWWQLDVTAWHLGLKRYRPGHRHAEHVDLGPTSQDGKIAASLLLSDPAEYEGGRLRLRVGGTTFYAPRDLGSGAVFPAWTPHLVEPITSGQRWVLIVTGVGPKLR